jgi:hypothetical protein
MRIQVKEAFVRVCLVAIAAILVASVALAQTDRGTITGTLADSTGAVVPGASVQVTNTETGAQYDTVTTGTGNYTLASLVAGNYNLTVAVTGFKKFTQEGIQVTVAQTARVDVTLEVGAISDAVTITADAPLLKTENADQSYEIAVNQRIDALPLPPLYVRNPLNWAGFVPGVVGNANGPAGSSTIKVNGSPATSYKVMVDGQDITSSIDPSHTLEQQPGVEMMQEVTLRRAISRRSSGRCAAACSTLLPNPAPMTYTAARTPISAMRTSMLPRLILTRIPEPGSRIGDSRWAGPCMSRKFTTAATRRSSSLTGKNTRTSR